MALRLAEDLQISSLPDADVACHFRQWALARLAGARGREPGAFIQLLPAGLGVFGLRGARRLGTGGDGAAGRQLRTRSRDDDEPALFEESLGRTREREFRIRETKLRRSDMFIVTGGRGSTTLRRRGIFCEPSHFAPTEREVF